MNRDLYEKCAGELYSPAHLNFNLVEKEQSPEIGPVKIYAQIYLQAPAE